MDFIALKRGGKDRDQPQYLAIIGDMQFVQIMCVRGIKNAWPNLMPYASGHLNHRAGAADAIACFNMMLVLQSQYSTGHHFSFTHRKPQPIRADKHPHRSPSRP